MSGRHFLADRDEVSDGFFFFFNTILTDLSGKGEGNEEEDLCTYLISMLWTHFSF